MQQLNIGLIGTDSSHAVAFTRLLNNPTDANHVSGGKVVAAFSGGSDDFPLSISRVDGFMNILENEFGVRRVDSPGAVAAQCDAVLLTSADGRIHLEQFRDIASYGKPVFIDKPMALNTKDAQEIFEIARQFQVPIMSCSALRYAQQLTDDVRRYGLGTVKGAVARGPLAVEPTQSYYYWYGIHSVELLYAVMGIGCEAIHVETRQEEDILSGRWKDGRIGTVQLSRLPDCPFSARIEREGQASHFEIQANAKPFYASLLEQIMELFTRRQSPLDAQETIEIIRFLEAAEESKTTGNEVLL